MHGDLKSGGRMRVEAVGKGGRSVGGVGEVMLDEQARQEGVSGDGPGCLQIRVQPANLTLQLSQPAALSLPALRHRDVDIPEAVTLQCALLIFSWSLSVLPW